MENFKNSIFHLDMHVHSSPSNIQHCQKFPPLPPLSLCPLTLVQVTCVVSEKRGHTCMKWPEHPARSLSPHPLLSVWVVEAGQGLSVSTDSALIHAPVDTENTKSKGS
ncbi:hypothetical protein CDAR_42251 [Caerostris darwini]|uniref:Uncharacterized protein n=1 Tax=Caerostris darwini TaxID=1538125 RepID=A0AAV4RH83_9ARAC|nr:hypothetical protein CDAR_42251 [Caerostris darwini]